MEKANYVKSQKQTRNHVCHWPNCGKQVPPAMWGCKEHWFKLPAGARKAIWATYYLIGFPKSDILWEDRFPFSIYETCPIPSHACILLVKALYLPIL